MLCNYVQLRWFMLIISCTSNINVCVWACVWNTNDLYNPAIITHELRAFSCSTCKREIWIMVIKYAIIIQETLHTHWVYDLNYGIFTLNIRINFHLYSNTKNMRYTYDSQSFENLTPTWAQVVKCISWADSKESFLFYLWNRIFNKLKKM